jgi:hypothetical protein
MLNKLLLLSLIPALLFSNTLQNRSSIHQARGAEDYEYLIATTDALKNSFDEFIEFNLRRCLRTQVQTIEYIRSNSTGSDDAERLRNYIKEQYEKYKIVYVLLGGGYNPNNQNGIPVREFRAQFYDQAMTPDKFYDIKDIAADMYYSCLDGDWLDSNQYFGEPGTEDLSWEVYASRLPVDNATETANIVNKIIKYSEQPVIEETVNNMLVAQSMWGSSYVNGSDYVEEFMDTCTTNGYTTIGFPSTKWATTRLYDDNNNEWVVEDFRDGVNNNKPTWIDHFGHGNPTYAFRETAPYVNVSNYKNNGINGNFFIMYVQAALAGKFNTTSDCILEKFVTITTGAVACIGYSNFNTIDDDGTNVPGQFIARLFHDAIFNKGIHYLEMMNAYSKEKLADQIFPDDLTTAPHYGAPRYHVYQTNVLGDPALSIWTVEPKELQADYPTPLTDTKFVWETKNPYTWVALLAEENILCTKLTDSSGRCEIDDEDLAEYIMANPNGTLKVRAKAHNHLPFEGTLPINYSTSINSINENLSFSYNFAFGNKLKIIYTVPARGYINISIFNSKGTLVRAIVNDVLEKGKHLIVYNIGNLQSGIYYCRLKNLQSAAVNKFLIIK